MTAPQANPSPRAQARRSLAPSTSPKKRGANIGKAMEARSRGTDTSNLSAAEMAEVIDPDKPLTEKQKAFVRFWAEGDSISSASRRAGYNDSGTIAYRMVKMPNILKMKSELSAKYEEAAQITRKSVMDMHLEAFEMAKLMSEPATMVSAARELGKMAGYYAPVEHKVKIDVTGNIVLDRMNSMTDAELLKVISQGVSSGSSTALGLEIQDIDSE